MSDDKKNILPYLSDDLLEEIAEAYDFEYKMFDAIGARSDSLVIIEEQNPTNDEKAEVFYHAGIAGTDVIYQNTLENGDMMLFVIDPSTRRIKADSLLGIVPTSKFKYHG